MMVNNSSFSFSSFLYFIYSATVNLPGPSPMAPFFTNIDIGIVFVFLAWIVIDSFRFKKFLKLQKHITIHPNEVKSIPMAIFVKKGAMGDGPGKLTVALYVKYIKGKKEKEELLTIISQSEDNGYQTGW